MFIVSRYYPLTCCAVAVHSLMRVLETIYFALLRCLCQHTCGSRTSYISIHTPTETVAADYYQVNILQSILFYFIIISI